LQLSKWIKVIKAHHRKIQASVYDPITVVNALSNRIKVDKSVRAVGMTSGFIVSPARNFFIYVPRRLCLASLLDDRVSAVSHAENFAVNTIIYWPRSKEQVVPRRAAIPPVIHF
jgi:hypothetical protein